MVKGEHKWLTPHPNPFSYRHLLLFPLASRLLMLQRDRIIFEGPWKSVDSYLFLFILGNSELGPETWQCKTKTFTS